MTMGETQKGRIPGGRGLPSRSLMVLSALCVMLMVKAIPGSDVFVGIPTALQSEAIFTSALRPRESKRERAMAKWESKERGFSDGEVAVWI